MSGDRYVVLGLAHTRSSWFGELGRWSTAAVVPVDFVKCLSPEEARARLASGRPFSALLIDGGHTGLDRDLIDVAKANGCPTIVVADDRLQRNWTELGAVATLPSAFDRTDLLDTLGAHAAPISDASATLAPVDSSTVSGTWRGRLMGVTGVGGAGCSTVAAAAAQAYGSDPRTAGRVVLADFCLDGAQALLHGSTDVVPAVTELVEAHRAGVPSVEDIRRLTFEVPDRGYRLLLGLRRHRDWVALRPRAMAASIDGLLKGHQMVVADMDPDLEGADDCGSIDVEERNVMARSVVDRADLIAVVATPDLRGLHGLVRVIGNLTEYGVEPERVFPVINQAPRRASSRAELAAALATLLEPATGSSNAPSPIFLPVRKGIDQIHRDRARLPEQLARPLLGASEAIFDRIGRRALSHETDLPTKVQPGTLGAWSDAV